MPPNDRSECAAFARFRTLPGSSVPGLILQSSPGHSRLNRTPRKEREMTLSETEKLTDILLAKQLELHGSVRNRDDIQIEKAPDALDEVQMMGERELAIRNLDRELSMLRQVR